MNLMLTHQTIQFLQSILLGAALSVLYDLFFVIRSLIPEKIRPYAFLDILYCLLTGIILFDYLLIENNGRIRYFIALGLAIGWLAVLSLAASAGSLIKSGFFSASFLRPWSILPIIYGNG